MAWKIYINIVLVSVICNVLGLMTLFYWNERWLADLLIIFMLSDVRWIQVWSDHGPSESGRELVGGITLRGIKVYYRALEFK